VNEILTISLQPDGTERVSIIHPHGERLVEPTVEVAIACAHLWRALVCGSTEYGHVDPLAKIAPQMSEAIQSIEQAKRDLQAPLQALDAILQAIRDLQVRFARLERAVANGWMSSEAANAWFAQLRHTQTNTIPTGAQ
jgi:hypothetical protein